MITLTTIISGGQTGVDQTALRIAALLGFQTGGTAPLGYRTDVGLRPDLLRDVYHLQESWSPSYRVRTRDNALAADGTVWFGDISSPGGHLTSQVATAHRLVRVNYLWIVNPTADQLLAALDTFPITTLNVAGNRQRTHPSSAAVAENILTEVLTAIRDARTQ